MSGFAQILQKASTASAVTSLTTPAMAANMTAGNKIVIAVKTSSATTVTSVTDTRGNTYVQRAQSPATPSGRGCVIFDCLSPGTPLTTADTVTANISGSSSGVSIIVGEYSGLVAADASGVNDSGASAVTSGTVATSVATTQASEVAIIGVAWSGSVTAIASTSAMTLRTGAASANSGLGALFDDNLSTIGTVSESFSWTTSAAYAAAVATYKLAAAPPGGG